MSNQFNGKLLVFTAPSGAGKTTIVHKMLEMFPETAFSISATTRKPRSYEANGKDYYFMPEVEFLEKVNKHYFVEYEKFYNNIYYGTLKSEIERIWKQKKHVLFDIDVKGALNIKKQFAEKALTIFIQPPSIETLKNRLLSRGTETAETIEIRISRAEYELSFANQFDCIILNESLEQAISLCAEKITDFLYH